MTTRRFVLFVALCALLPETGCTTPVEMPGEKEQPDGWGLPVAPAPRAKKTTAELLVGTWREVECNGRPTPPGDTFLRTFTADGRLDTFSEMPHDPPRKTQTHRWSGTYSVSGKTVRSRVVHTNGDVSEAVMTITELSETRLVCTGRSEYKSAEFRYPFPIVAEGHVVFERGPAKPR